MIYRTWLFLLFFLLSTQISEAADRALFVGVEKYKDPRVAQTPGCEADARETAEFVKSKFGFPESSIKLLLNEQAAAANIEETFREWLIEDTQPGDRVFFFYAGHGSQLPDDNGDEEDGYDETIAPYDVDVNTGDNQIRDDLFDLLIGQLSGRRAVIVFDSCHSGTISRGEAKLSELPHGGGARYLPRPDQIRAIDAAGARGGVSYTIVPEANGRKLTLGPPFVETDRLESLQGVVVISAASANQIAYPLKINGKYRGALSYLFAETQRGDIPALRVLKSRIADRVKDLQARKELKGNQQPQFEALSTFNLDDRPLYGTWEQAPEVALINPFSKIKLSIQTGEGKLLYRGGENISYRITANTPGYLYLIVFSEQNVATCLFPNKYDPDNQVSSGIVAVPRGGHAFPIQEPFGRDVVVAVLSKEKFNIGEKTEYSWAEVFERLNLRELHRTIGKKIGNRGQGVKANTDSEQIDGWQGATIVIETKGKETKRK